MATNLRTCHPGDGIDALNRLPGLAEPLLQIDLDQELQHLRREDSWHRETRRSSKTLAKYPDFRIVLILMKSGTRMRQHKAEGRISIQQLKGKVCIHLAERKVTVSAGHLLVLDCGVLHDVEALEESALLLTISWRREKSDTTESFSSAQRHLDEQAVSRMDDEGGTHGATEKAAARISYTTWFPIQVKMTFNHLVMMRRFQMLCLSVIPERVVDESGQHRSSFDSGDAFRLLLRPRSSASHSVIHDQDQHSPNHSNDKAIKVYARDAMCSEHAEHPAPDYRANDSQHNIQEYSFASLVH